VTEWTAPGFTELARLGEGGFGRVVLARQDATGSVFAIKYLLAGGDRAAFRREALLLRRVVSPYVARLYDFVETSSGTAIVMEAVPGVSLRALLSSAGVLPPEAAFIVLRGSLLGLAAAHSVGLVHRDYKPGNVLVQPNRRSKLVDFGTALLAGHSGQAIGTPAYMAPEQWVTTPAMPASDVYAATCVFYQCVMGSRPFEAATKEELRDLHRHAAPPVGQLPDPLRALVSRGLAKSAADRPTAAFMVAELEVVAGTVCGREWENAGWSWLAAAAGGLLSASPMAWLISATGVLGPATALLSAGPGLAAGAGAAGAGGAGAGMAGGGAGLAGAAAGVGAGTAGAGTAATGLVGAGAAGAGAGAAGAGIGAAGAAGAGAGGAGIAGAAAKAMGLGAAGTAAGLAGASGAGAGAAGIAGTGGAVAAGTGAGSAAVGGGAGAGLTGAGVTGAAAAGSGTPLVGAIAGGTGAAGAAGSGTALGGAASGSGVAGTAGGAVGTGAGGLAAGSAAGGAAAGGAAGAGGITGGAAAGGAGGIGAGGAAGGTVASGSGVAAGSATGALAAKVAAAVIAAVVVAGAVVIGVSVGSANKPSAAAGQDLRVGTQTVQASYDDVKLDVTAGIVQVSGHRDRTVQRAINDSLRAPVNDEVTLLRDQVASARRNTNGHPRQNAPFTLKVKPSIRLQNNNFLSVRYDNQPASDLITNSSWESFNTVTVDLRTGRALGPTAIFGDKPISQQTADQLADALEAQEPGNICGIDRPLRLTPTDFVDRVQIAYTRDTVEFTLVLPLLTGYANACGIPTVGVAYDDIRNLTDPRLAAELTGG
jgi:hypothetical protein